MRPLLVLWSLGHPCRRARRCRLGISSPARRSTRPLHSRRLNLREEANLAEMREAVPPFLARTCPFSIPASFSHVLNAGSLGLRGTGSNCHTCLPERASNASTRPLWRVFALIVGDGRSDDDYIVDHRRLRGRHHLASKHLPVARRHLHRPLRPELRTGLAGLCIDCE